VPLRITSEAFKEGEPIPSRFTCAGADVSPPLAWSGVPQNAKVLALVVEDPDAPGGTWTHWTFWNLPAAVKVLPEGADVAAMGATQGTTGAKSTGYHGPCPPSGTHRYFFRLYALSQPLTLPEGSRPERLRAAMTGRVLAEAQLMGTFAKTQV
jgi:Raf kinase inhibitor-like YbhB/YbcL family protein